MARVIADDASVAARRLAATAVWLAACFIAVKAYYLGVPKTFGPREAWDYLGDLAATSYGDVLFAAWFWLAGRLALAATAGPRAIRPVSYATLGVAAFCALYAVANIVVFGVFGGFVSYPMLSLVGDVGMVQSSIGTHVTLGTLSALFGVPLLFIATVVVTSRRALPARWRAAARGVAVAVTLAWVGLGMTTYGSKWRGRPDRRVAANPPWVLASSWWQAETGDGVVHMPLEYPPSDLSDFQAVQRPSTVPVAMRSRDAVRAVVTARRPPNVILIVLESVGLRWTSLAGGIYDTTPMLGAEAARAAVFPNAYAHIGRSSNSLAAILLSSYPKLDFREITEQFPNLPGTSLATVFRDRGYRTAFMTPSDLSWAGWGRFLGGRGFTDVRDYHDMSWCPDMLSSWGVEDRCLVDGMVRFVEEQQVRPFFLMAWTTQTHHPYDMSPGVPEIEFRHENTPDDWDLGHYLNVVHEDDRQLGRLFDAVRRAGLENDTLIVVTGDHGQAFGYPHQNSYIQGRSVYQEDVNVPLMFWFPRAYRTGSRPATVAGHVDVAPTIAALAGISPASDWQGRDLFDATEAHRAYFYVAEDTFTLGVREDNWKYIYDLRDGTEELYDLDRDPTEQNNQAAHEPGRAARLRQRLAAWTEANRRQYAGTLSR